MSITTADIEKKTFSTALRGYDLDEVDDFLDEMVVAVRELQEELSRAKERVAQLENDPEAVAAMAVAAAPAPDESAVGRALVAAQEAADRMLEEARSEAEKIVGDARSEADTFAQERDLKKAEVDAEMAQMTGLVAGVRHQLAILATAVADKLDEMDAVVPGAHGNGLEDAETGTGTAESSDDGEVDDEPQAEDDQPGDDDGGDEGEPGEAGLEVDVESLESEAEDDDAGSSEIAGVDSDEGNQEI